MSVSGRKRNPLFKNVKTVTGESYLEVGEMFRLADDSTNRIYIVKTLKEVEKSILSTKSCDACEVCDLGDICSESTEKVPLCLRGERPDMKSVMFIDIDKWIE